MNAPVANLDFLKERAEISFMVIDRLSPTARAVINEIGCPYDIYVSALSGVPGPLLVKAVEDYALANRHVAFPQSFHPTHDR